MNRYLNESLIHRDEVTAVCPVCSAGCDIQGKFVVCPEHGEFDALTLTKERTSDE